jgi:hypothetical protein
MTGQEFIDNAANVLNQTATKAGFITEVLFWANLIQDDMFIRGDWAELIRRNYKLTADGSTEYDLTAALKTGAGATVSDFGRLRERSVRFNNIRLDPYAVAMLDEEDPDNSDSGTPDRFAVTGNYFIPKPYPSSGDFTLDIVITPAAIEQATEEADISFAKQNHTIIYAGVLFMGMQRYGTKDWTTQFGIYEKMCDRALSKSGKVRHTPRNTIVNPY